MCSFYCQNDVKMPICWVQNSVLSLCWAEEKQHKVKSCSERREKFFVALKHSLKTLSGKKWNICLRLPNVISARKLYIFFWGWFCLTSNTKLSLYLFLNVKCLLIPNIPVCKCVCDYSVLPLGQLNELCTQIRCVLFFSHWVHSVSSL